MRKLLALILALGLVFAPIAIAGTQDDEVSVGGYTDRTLVTLLYNIVTALNESTAGGDDNIALLNNWNTLVKEVAADVNTAATVLPNWETLIEEVGADLNTTASVLPNWETLLEEMAVDMEAMKAVFTNWSAEMALNANVSSMVLKAPPANLTANQTVGSASAALTANVSVGSVAAALSANTVPANVTAPTVTDGTIGSGTKADPSISTRI